MWRVERFKKYTARNNNLELLRYTTVLKERWKTDYEKSS